MLPHIMKLCDRIFFIKIEQLYFEGKAGPIVEDVRVAKLALLMLYWCEGGGGVTNISLEQFYKPLVDPRTVGKPSKESSYTRIYNGG